MNKRTRACAITPKVKKAVEKRDGECCIFCGKRGKGEAHFIPRSHGGLGIEQNLLTVCRPCHDRLDNSTDRKEMLKIAEQYLRSRYQGWNKESLIYKKGMETKCASTSKFANTDKKYIVDNKTSSEGKKTECPQGFWFIN